MRKCFTFSLISTLVIVAVFFSCELNGQESKKRLRSVGLGYYGELGLHPGIQADVTFEIADNSTRRYQNRKLLFRPALIYFYRPYYTHNYMVLPNVVFQLGARQKETFLFYFEVSGKAGYLRYQYIGDQYLATPTGIQSINRQGGNGFVYGLGFLIGIKTNQSQRSYYLSLDYLNELTEDSIRPNLIGIKVGVRFGQIQFKKKVKNDKSL